jgi:chitodextrinase
MEESGQTTTRMGIRVTFVLGMLLSVFYSGPGWAAFSDGTETRGIGLDESGAAGAAFGDYDNDGDEDLYVTRQGKQNSLYRNNGAGNFSDVTLDAGVQHPAPGCDNAWGAAWGDYDNDEDLDLYVTYETGCLNALFENNGDGTFTEVTDEVGVEGGGIAHKPSRTASWSDYNRDGRLDLYVANRGDDDPAAPDRNLLYRGKGDGTLEDVAGDLHVDGGNTLSFTGVWSDYDNDGDVDLFLASDFHGIELFKNEGAGGSSDSFSRITSTAFPGQLIDTLGPSVPGTNCVRESDGHRVDNSQPGHVHCLLDEPAVGLEPPDPTYGALPLNAMGICAGDYNNDGQVDFYVTNFSADEYQGSNQDHHGKLESALWQNNGDGTFTERARAAGINTLAGSEDIDTNGTVLVSIQERETVEWGCNFLDYDNDGDLDLYVVSGNPPSLSDATLIKRDSLYRNEGDGRFTDVTEAEGLLGSGDDCETSCSTDGEAAGFGSAVADVDDDGDLDIFVANNTFGSSRFYVNGQETENHWLKVRLKGTVQKFGVGARVIVTVGGKKQIREVIAGSGYLSMDSLIQHFGLGDATTVDRVEVLWPGKGAPTVILNPAVDQTLTIEEAQAACDSADTTPPDAPADVKADATIAGRIGLTWTASSDNLDPVCVQGYRITRNHRGGTVSVDTSTYVDQTVLSDVSDYCYTIVAVDTAGNESPDSEEVCAGTAPDITPPTAPEGLAATVLSHRDVSLTWTLSTDDFAVDAYQIYRDDKLVVTQAAPPYEDGRLTTGVSYCYTVFAIDQSGNVSETSMKSCATPKDVVPPGPPAALATTRVGATGVDLDWDTATDEVGVEKYLVYRNGLLVGESSKTAFQDVGLNPGTTYDYLIYAQDAEGNISLESASLKVTTALEDDETGGGGGGGVREEEASDDRNETEKCFLSTVAFGSLMASQLDIVRAFRDHYLQPSRFGRFLIREYYHHSPSLSRAIVGNEGLRALVRMALWPLIGMAWMTLVSPLLTVLFMGLFMGLILLAGMNYYKWIKSNGF